ncbi:MAG: hypothetical protein IPG18_11475 [Saprospiraceae bacterium]|nr:hypothetical protein [Saprospiraceae bacterium]
MQGTISGGSAATQTSACLAVTNSTEPVLDLRNNIFTNTQLGNSGATLRFAAIALGYSTFTTLTSNNNDLFCAGAGPGTYQIGITGTVVSGTNSTTLADWRTLTGKDLASINVLPTFQSATDLKLNMGLTSTQLESGGASVGISTDIDCQSRPGPAGSVNGGATAPDMGADEFDGVPAVPMTYVSSTVTQVTGGSATPSTNQQVIRIEVVTAGVVSPISLTSLTLNANGTTNIADINAATAKIYYTGATPTFSPVGLFGSLTPTIANFNITGSQALLSGSNYFWLAYDVTAGATNGNLLDGECVSITVGSPQTPTVTMPSGSRTIVGPMAGNYNVGTGQVFPNFVTITEAGSNLVGRGVSGAVTITLLDAAYNTGTGESFPLILTAITGASSTNTVTFKPGTSVNTVVSGAVASGALIRLNGADFVTIDGSNSGGTDKSMTIENTSTTSLSTVIWVSSLGTGAGATNNTIKNCNIKGGNIVTNTASFGIFAGGTTISDGGTGDDNDDLTIQNNTITKASIGVYARAASSVLNNLNIVGNTIGSATATDYITRKGITIAQATDGTINSNTVFNLITASVSGTLTAIESGAGVTNYTIHKNNIDEISNTGTSVFRGGQGITLNTGAVGANVSVFNNMIGNLKGDGSGTLTNNSWGVMVLSGGGYAIDYNTINIDDNRLTTSSADLSGGIHLAATATSVSLRNNLISVTGLPGNPTTGRMFGIHSLAAAPFTVSNYNDLYVTGAQHSVGFLTSNRNTLADWQTASSQDANSIFVLPLYQSATDLHLNMGLTSTQLEQGGIVVANDIDCQTRPGPTGSVNGGATAPDMGADEFDGVPAVPMTYVSSTVTQVTGGAFAGVINQEIIRIQVVTAGTLSPLSLTSLDLNANGTSVITDIDATTAKVYYTGASTTFSTGTLFGATTPTIATFTVAGTQTLASGNNYFWLAYDVIPGATPGNFIDGECTSITVGSPQAPSTPAPAGNKVIVGPMAGNYNVGTAMTFPNFATLTNAVANLNARGVSAAVTLTLMDATYNAGSGETFPLNINTIAGASGVNTITIRPNTGVAAAISGASATSGIFKLNGADYVTINGLNTGGSSLSIANTSATITSCVIWIASASLTDGATNNVIRNCSLTGASNTTTVAGIIAGSGTTLGDAAQSPNSNNTIAGNTIKTAQNGLYLRGEATTFDDSWVVSKNVIGSTVGAEKMTFRGILIGNALNMAVDSNTIIGVVSTASSSSTTTGIHVAFATSGGSVTRNSIRDIKQINTTGWGSNGIFLAQTSTTANLAVANNFISDVASDGFNDDTASDNGYGIMVNTGGGYNIYNNTIAMNTEQVKTTGITAAINIAAAVVTTSSLNIRNNIFSTTQTVGTNYSIYNASLGGNAIFTNINYNDYVSTEHIGFLTTSRTTLGNWQTATAQDANSVSIAPVFTSATDLHLPDGSNGSLFDLGTPIAGITKDIDNQDRSATAPDMGADEFSPITLNLTAFIEGYYVGGSPPLRDVLGLSGVPGSNSTQCDTITVQLRNSTTPFAVAASFMGVLNRDGILACKFPSDKQGGTYFVALQHRNALETWSGGGDGLSATSFSAVTTNYNFTTSANQAYGGNMKGMGGGGTAPFAIYSGDIDSDGEVLPADYNLWLISNTNGDIGYYPTDLDGDGEVLPADYAIWLVNNNLGVLISIP